MSVYDRLYRQSTASSAQKTISPRRSSGDSNRSRAQLPKTKSLTKSFDTPSLDRLCRPTEASILKQQLGTDSSFSQQKKLISPEKPKQPASKASPGTIEPREKTSKAKIPPNLGSAYEGPWKVTYTCKYDKRNPKEIRPLSSQNLNISQFLYHFEQGKLSEHQFSHDIIEALFKRDFMPGKRWDIDPAWVSLEGGEGNVVKFKAEKQATWDWKDIYAVASAKGTICFFPDKHEIRVQEYSHYVAG